MFSRIDHVALHVSDLGKSVDFYTNNFGFKQYFDYITKSGIRIVYLRLNDTVLELLDNGTRKIDDMHLALHATDFERAIEHMQQHNVPAHQAPHPTPARESGEENWLRATFIGPDNEVIEIRG